MRFELIDRVLERGQDRLVAVKNVTSAEEYLGDHFPGFPVLPGVMMLETLVQAGRLLAADLTAAETPAGQAPANLILAEVRNVRYGNMVRPGQTLKVEVTLRGRDAQGFDLNGVGSVDDQVAVQGRFRLAPLQLETPTPGNAPGAAPGTAPAKTAGIA
ncbi:MAG: beta-hydroxyacyl-ACP dehydratase [Planctomycetota bacterium]|nr:beta-hydroxyacyl-ACP dehydratase [Planctomycetota bacterium]